MSDYLKRKLAEIISEMHPDFEELIDVAAHVTLGTFLKTHFTEAGQDRLQAFDEYTAVLRQDLVDEIANGEAVD